MKNKEKHYCVSLILDYLFINYYFFVALCCQIYLVIIYKGCHIPLNWIEVEEIAGKSQATITSRSTSEKMD